MKIRRGFVSNSSSSSFIVIASNPLVEFVRDGAKGNDKYKGKHLTFGGGNGHSQFGWEERKYYSLFDKVNFAYLQASLCSRPEFIEMLEEVILNATGASSVTFDLDTANYDNYIDHQSVGGDNLEMFTDAGTLRCFLFNPDSYIQGDNDNH